LLKHVKKDVNKDERGTGSLEEDFRGRDLLREKEMTAEFGVSFIWAEVIDFCIGALGISITQSVGKERFSHFISTMFHFLI
jgi:hypothetical protein